jgi:hypothetical protein
MRTHSFAILFGPQTASGTEAAATHLPLVVKDEGEHGLLEGHFAHANPHWKLLAGQETLVVFSGPHTYVSPTLYAEPLSVPTWNYIAVHAYGTLSLVEDEPGKDALLAGLIDAHEPAFAEKWRRMPEGFRRTIAFPLPASKANSNSARIVPRPTAATCRQSTPPAIRTRELWPRGWRACWGSQLPASCIYARPFIRFL